MPDRSRKARRTPSSDPNVIAKRLMDSLPGDVAPASKPRKKNAAAVALGRKGGLVGGKARAAAMTEKQRSASAKKAAKARWGRKAS